MIRTAPFHLSLLLVAALSACGGASKLRPEDKSPEISKISKQKQPDRNKLAIILSDPVAPDPEKALENYRAILFITRKIFTAT